MRTPTFLLVCLCSLKFLFCPHPLIAYVSSERDEGKEGDPTLIWPPYMASPYSSICIPTLIWPPLTPYVLPYMASPYSSPYHHYMYSFPLSLCLLFLLVLSLLLLLECYYCSCWFCPCYPFFC